MKQPQITPDDIVYISGPMSGIKNANREAFDAVEKDLVEKFGCRVLNPARGMPDGLQYRQYMAHAMTLLSNATAVVSLPGWEESLGARIESACATRDGLKTFSATVED